VVGDAINREDPYATDIFVHDRETGITTRVSIDSDGIGAGCAATSAIHSSNP
jgi:hypothetical protein